MDNRTKVLLAGLGIGGAAALWYFSQKKTTALPPPPPPSNANLYGYIIDSHTGERLPGANLILQVGGTYGPTGTTSDNNGYYIFPNLPTGGPYSLICSLDGYQDKLLDVTLVAGNNPLSIGLDAVVVPPPQLATVSGIVSNSATGLPIAGALISLATGIPTVNSAADGRYSFSGFLSGLYTIIVQAAGYEMSSTLVNLLPGANAVDIELTPVVAPPPAIGTPGAEGFGIDVYNVNGISSQMAWVNSLYLPAGDSVVITSGPAFHALYGSDEDGNRITVDWPALRAALTPYADILHYYILGQMDPWYQEHHMTWLNIRDVAGLTQVYRQFMVYRSQSKGLNVSLANLYTFASTSGLAGAAPITVSFKILSKPYLPSEGYMKAMLYVFPAAYSRCDTGGLVIPNKELPVAYGQIPNWQSGIIQMPENGQTASLTLYPRWQPTLPIPGGLYHALVYFPGSSVPEGVMNSPVWPAVRIKNLLSF